MAKLTFETELCKGCALCVDVCPRKILYLNREQMNQKGHIPVAIKDERMCIGCGFCATICPDCVITIDD